MAEFQNQGVPEWHQKFLIWWNPQMSLVTRPFNYANDDAWIIDAPNEKIGLEALPITSKYNHSASTHEEFYCLHETNE
jgi:hypothetical protein